MGRALRAGRPWALHLQTQGEPAPALPGLGVCRFVLKPPEGSISVL